MTQLVDAELGSDTKLREDLKNLLRFAEGLLAERGGPVFDISTYPVRLTESDLRGTDGEPLPGVRFGATEDVWLSLARLAERRPPEPPPSLAAWLRREGRPSPTRTPMLLAERAVAVSAEEASELIEADLVAADAVARLEQPAGKPPAEHWLAPLRPSDLPEVIAQLAAYVDGAWRAWAVEEAPRRQSMRIYDALFKAQAQIAAAGGEGGLELVAGIGLARWRCGEQRVNLPLIEQRAEFVLEDQDGTLSIMPRTVPPEPALEAFLSLGVPGAAELHRDMTDRLQRVTRDPDLVFGPTQPASFRGILETCAARLDASGTVLAPDEELGVASEMLRISPTLCVTVRPRRDNVLRDDLRRLSEQVLDQATALPETASRFVVGAPDTLPGLADPFDLTRLAPPPTSAGADPTWSAREGDRGVARDRGARLFFPLPANAEQEEIARRLEQNDVYGVVVQGPPGTGKTHTIANVVGHWMASGRRVLVSAHTAEALTAIRDKLLPSGLGDLVVAVTHSDREGARQLEAAVSALAGQVGMIDRRQSRQRIEDLLLVVDHDEARMEAIDAELAAIARANLTEMPWLGASALPQAIAVWVGAQGTRHAWFPDSLDLIPAHTPRFGEAEVAELRALRVRLGSDLAYRVDDLPADRRALPSTIAMLAAHRALRANSERAVQEREGGLPRLDHLAAQPGEPGVLLGWLERLAAWRDRCGEHVWMHSAWPVLAAGRQTSGYPVEGLRPILEEAAALAAEGQELALLALHLPEVADTERLATALDNLSAGRKPFGPFSGLRRSPERQAVEAARIAGEKPGAQDWPRFSQLHAWRRRVSRFGARWNAMAGRSRFTPLPDPHLHEGLDRLGRCAAEMLALAAEAPLRHQRLCVLFPYGVDVDAVVWRLEVSLAVPALRASMASADLLEAERLRTDLAAMAERCGGALGQALSQLADGLGSDVVAKPEIAELLSEIHGEADRLGALRGDMKRLATLTGQVRDCGAQHWAERLAREPPDQPDTLLPPDWRDAWECARASRFLARIVDRNRTRDLTSERAALIEARERAFREVIVLRTYLGLAARLTESVLAALRQFLAALARLPKTAGAKTAVRQRRILRDSLQRAVRAVPCWVMPEWRVAEQLPPEIGGFDLVVIDEASQSNILALPVVLRGRKLLIVGDDRQVSPVAVGIEDATVARLRAIHLAGQPLADQIDPATSLYELGGMMYPGRVVVLREHFRCVESIIRFSARFYGGHLIPLRLPKASERIDPPLVDILVEDGARRGDENAAEATVIVDEIRRIVDDASLHQAGPRSIGVISLHAARQANAIYERLMQAIGPDAIQRHRIMCGDAATFQGQERDIVFLSMVHDAQTAQKQSSRMFEQRYNVALSRARDRMVLVRSLTESALKDGDIKLEVLRHFRDPFAAGGIAQSADVLAACESGFERAVGARLLADGYRLRAQVPAGGYRIDFVVEGGDDRRLAIELDGDGFHGPDRWAQDARRQKALERVGWTFWRCWASEWQAYEEATFADLVATLRAMGIDPIGADRASDPVAVEFRSVCRGAVREPSADIPDTAVLPATQIETIPPPQPVVVSESAAPPPAHELPDRIVSVGDEVVVRYADGDARSLTLCIVADGSADGRTRIAATAPLAQAILGLRHEDETEIIIAGRRRTVFVEDIRRAA